MIPANEYIYDNLRPMSIYSANENEGDGRLQ